MSSELAPSGESAVLGALTSAAYVALHTSTAGSVPVGEVSTSSTGYGRQGPIAFTNTGSNPTVAKNTSIVSFNQATAAWGTVT